MRDEQEDVEPLREAASKISYLEFIDHLGLKLTKAQRAFASLAFDGKILEGPENDALFGTPELHVAEAARKTAVAVCGRGSGKSLLGGSRVLHLAMTVDVSGLQPREIAVCPVVAPDLDTAQQVVRFALGFAEALQLRITNRRADGEEEFSIWSSGRRVRIVARAASAGGSSVRGRSMPCAVLDEAAFFRDSNHKVNDADIFKALKPRIMPGGQILLLSSPWIESGLLYELFLRNFGHCVDAVVAHAPTGLMRTDSPDVLRDIELERLVDPENCARERDAVFATANAKSFFNPKAVNEMSCPEGDGLNVALTHFVAGDFAFRRNSTAFCSVQVSYDAEQRIQLEVTELAEHMPRKGALKPSVICTHAAEFAKRSFTDEVIADAHFRETVIEELEKHSVTYILAPAGAEGKADVYSTTRSMMHEGRIRLPRSLGPLADKLIRQLKETFSRSLSGGGVSIDNPLWRSGEHGDLVSAFTLAVWRAVRMSGGMNPVKAVSMDVHGADALEQREMLLAQAEGTLRERLFKTLGLRRRA